MLFILLNQRSLGFTAFVLYNFKQKLYDLPFYLLCIS